MCREVSGGINEEKGGSNQGWRETLQEPFLSKQTGRALVSTWGELLMFSEG